MTKAADDFEAIRRRLEELAAEKNLALTGTSVPKTDDKQEDSFWTNVGSGVDYCAMKPSEFNEAARKYMSAGTFNLPDVRGKVRLASLAHPEWPYAGTAHEWRGFVNQK